MRVTLAVLADYANISQEGKLNILGIFDRIAVSEVPTSLPQMHFIMRLEAHAAERDRTHSVEIRLHDPDGQAVFEIKGEVVPRGGLPGQPVLTNQILGINNLRLKQTGGYMFVVFVNNDLKAEVPLVVDHAPRPSVEA